MNKKEKALEWAKEFETAKTWLSNVQAEKTGSEKTQLEYAYRLQAFCEWAKKNPDQLITERKEQLKSEEQTANRKTEQLVTDFFNFQAKQSDRLSAKAFHGALRSFFKYNYTSLRSETPRAMAKRIAATTMEEFKQIDAVASPRDRALLRFLKDSGMSTEDAVVPRYGDIRKEFEQDKDFIHIPAVRQKTQVHYDTFIGPNAVEALRTYFQIRKKRGEVFTDKTALFLSHITTHEPLNENSVRTVFGRLKEKIGITVSPHRVRKLFSSYMALRVRSPVVLKYWMGHSVESSDIEGRYQIPPLPEQLKLYQEAYSQIDIAPKVEDRVKAIEEAMEKMSPEAKAIMEKHGLQLRQRGKKTQNSEDCDDGLHCEKIVNEEELGELLPQGWKVKIVLPSGKVVAEK